MIINPAEKYQERMQLIEDSIALKETSRVLNGVRVNAYPFFEYGVSIKDSMTDYQKAIDAYIRYHREFQPDLASGFASQASAKVFELMGVKCMRWPGNGLDDNSLMQYIEYATLEEDEYDEFFADPTGFAYRKWLPRMFSVFEPFADIEYMKMMTGIYRAPQNAFTSPAMIDSYKRLIAASEEQQKFDSFAASCSKTLREDGFPSMVAGSAATAFDLLADGLRGTFGIMTDLMDQPEIVEKCCKIFVDFQIQNSLGSYKRSGNKFQWTMLHKGFDNFISDEMYAKYYWPYLRQWIIKLIDEGVVPVVFCEGTYTTRLKYLADVPKGKVIYVFEKVDIREAKRILGGTACIMGGFPVYTVTHGTPQKIHDQVKEYMDVLAPGGGYIFSLSTSIDNAPRANVEALFEAVERYGAK